MGYVHARTIAGRGDAADRFRSSLHGITAGDDGRLYAAGDSEIKVFETAGALRHRWTTARQPFAVAVAKDRRVFVGESGQIEIFDRNGRLLNTWSDTARLGRVSALGFVGDDVLAADTVGRAIRHYAGDGRFLNDIGRDNRMQGFVIPNGCLDFSVDAAGIIHASNPGKHRIERYTADGRMLGFIGRFGPDPAGFSGCCNPTNVTVSGPDRLYVTEKAGPRVKVYDFGGRLLEVIASEIFDPNCKNMDLCVDARGTVYVVDTARLEIQVFEPGADA